MSSVQSRDTGRHGEFAQSVKSSPYMSQKSGSREKFPFRDSWSAMHPIQFPSSFPNTSLQASETELVESQSTEPPDRLKLKMLFSTIGRAPPREAIAPPPSLARFPEMVHPVMEIPSVSTHAMPPPASQA